MSIHLMRDRITDARPPYWRNHTNEIGDYKEGLAITKKANIEGYTYRNRGWIVWAHFVFITPTSEPQKDSQQEYIYT